MNLPANSALINFFASKPQPSYIGWKSWTSWAFFVTELDILNVTMKSFCRNKIENHRKCMTCPDQNSLWSHKEYEVPSQKSINSLISSILYQTVEVTKQKNLLGPSWLANPPPSFNDFLKFFSFWKASFLFTSAMDKVFGY